MLLHGSVKLLMRLCQFCGLVPISLKQKDPLQWEKSSRLKAISIVLTILSGIIFLIIIIWPEWFLNPIDSKIRRTLFHLLIITNHIPAMVAIFELSLKCEQQVKLWNIFQKLDILLESHLNQKLNYTNLRKKCNRLILAWICECLLLVAVDTYSKFQTIKSTRTSQVAVTFPTYVLTRLALSYSIMLILIIHGHLDVLNKYVKSLNKQNGYYIRDQYAKQTDVGRFKWAKLIKSKSGLNIETVYSLKYIYCEIWKATEITKNLTQWTLMSALSNEFAVLTFNIYSIFVCIFYKLLPMSRVKVLLVFLANNLCNLLFIAHYSNKILEDVSKKKATDVKAYVNLNFVSFAFRWIYFRRI